MDVKAYIESGILEQYVSGLLPDEENLKVDELARKYPDIKLEIDSIRASVNNLASKTGNTPSPDILNAVQSTIEVSESKPVSEAADTSKFAGNTPWLTIAATILLTVSIGVNIYFFSSINEFRENQANALEEISKLYEQMDFVTSEANLRVPLEGLEISPNSHATVYINKQTRDVYIKIGDLPAPPSGHQYQLWADRDGHMHSIGVFHHNKDIQHLAIFEGEFESLNVTLEEEGGSENATVEQAYLSGRI
ncbi:MAG: anti-sigma factor [Balneolales bacterium]|nr:anti-sigma factor [Balneolales bacterium]